MLQLQTPMLSGCAIPVSWSECTTCTSRLPAAAEPLGSARGALNTPKRHIEGAGSPTFTLLWPLVMVHASGAWIWFKPHCCPGT